MLGAGASLSSVGPINRGRISARNTNGAPSSRRRSRLHDRDLKSLPFHVSGYLAQRTVSDATTDDSHGLTLAADGGAPRMERSSWR